MLKVAMLSRWHEHGNRYVAELKNIPEAEIACVWDENVERGVKWANELGVKYEASLDRVLASPEIGGVCITAPTNMHKEIILKAAAAGKHVFCEKTLALSVSDALEIKEAVERTGIKFTMAFPRRSNPEFAYAKTLYDAGELGELTFLRVRNGTTVENIGLLPDYWFRAEQTGGGAMMDLGCHPIYLAFGMLGEPVSINSTFTHIFGKENEDGAVCNILFKNKAIAMVESTYNAPLLSVYTFEAYGTKAAYLVSGVTGTVHIKRVGKPVEQLRYAELPAGPATPMRQWVNACVNGGTTDFGVDEGVLLTRILCAAYQANREGRTVSI